jgi:hypothetical protein
MDGRTGDAEQRSQFIESCSLPLSILLGDICQMMEQIMQAVVTLASLPSDVYRDRQQFLQVLDSAMHETEDGSKGVRFRRDRWS